MSKYLWITDPHLNFLSKSQTVDFLERLKEYQPTGIFLTGDISTGQELTSHLQLALDILSCHIYFVLGNHDYYHSSFGRTQDEMLCLVKDNPNLHYLNLEEPISLSNDVAIIGDDGWYDAGWHRPLLPVVFLADWYFIDDFRFNRNRMGLMYQHAKGSVKRLKVKLEKALEKHNEVYMLTHFPPWPEKTDRLFGLAERFWKPYNSCKILADMLTYVMDRHPNKKLTIFAGHTHSRRYEKMTQNIELRIGQAWHGKCQVEDIICL